MITLETEKSVTIEHSAMRNYISLDMRIADIVSQIGADALLEEIGKQAAIDYFLIDEAIEEVED